MCSTCGCGQSDEEVKISLLSNDLKFDATENSGLFRLSPEIHGHHHDPVQKLVNSGDLKTTDRERTIISVQEDILGRNKLIAKRNRGFLEAKGITGINMVSSPGSGKTSLLEKTLVRLKLYHPVFVIEGDQQTSFDAERIQATGVKVVQINTGQGCHLDAEMVHKAIKTLEPTENSFLFIENVGNLVCPALFDLGESKRVVIISVTEGADKPLKYPYMFETSDLCIINKTDLLPYVDFDIQKTKEFALRVNHRLSFIEMSVKTGEGIIPWIDWLEIQKTPVVRAG